MEGDTGMKLIEYPDRDLMMIDLADRISSELKNTLLTQDRATFCVPGGTTPGPAFDCLSAATLDWDRVTILLGDERCVPEDHARSNTRLVRKRLLVGRAAAARLQSLHIDGVPPEEAASLLSEQVEPLLPITVLLLGMGGDGHTASIFPDGDRRDDALAVDAPAVVPMRTPTADDVRMTLTAPVLQSALSIHILITGPEKRAKLEATRTLSPREAPVKAVLNNAIVHWAE